MKNTINANRKQFAISDQGKIVTGLMTLDAAETKIRQLLYVYVQNGALVEQINRGTWNVLFDGSDNIETVKIVAAIR